MCEKSKKMGIGVVIRDDKGDILACLCSSTFFYSKPIITEFGALWRAMRLGMELGFKAIQLEGDAEVLINSINSEA